MDIGERKRRYGENALDGACATIRAAKSVENQGEGRNITLNGQAFSLGQRSAFLELDDSYTLARLAEAAVDAGLQRGAAQRTAASGYHAGKKSPIEGFLDSTTTPVSPKPRRTAPSSPAKPSQRYATRQEAIDSVASSIRREHPDAKLVAQYDYLHTNGELAHVVLRFEFTVSGEPDKTFRQITPVEDGYVIGLNGCDRRPLYNLPAIVQLAPGTDVLDVEGEKAQQAANLMGYHAVTSMGGSNAAGKSDWSPMKGHHLIIIPDNDEAGEKRAREVQKLAIEAGALSVLIVRMKDIWSDAQPGDDLADLVETVDVELARQWVDDAIERARAGNVQKPSTSTKAQKHHAQLVEHVLSDIAKQAVSWIWDKRVPREAITILEGDPGQGKSFITLDVAARVSRGWAMPPASRGEQTGEPRKVILVSAEDSLERTIKPRLMALGADQQRIICIETVHEDPNDPITVRPVCFPKDLSLVEDSIVRHNADLLVIDPFSAMLTEKADSNKESDMRRILHLLKLMAERTGVAILIVRHLNKMSTETNVMYRGGGSIGIIGAARSAFVVGAHPDDEAGDRRVLARTKGNLCATPPSLEYRVEVQDGVPVVHWEGEVDITAQELATKTVSSGRDDKKALAKDFLTEKLAHGEMAACILEEQAKAAGISKATLRRAKNEMGISSRRSEFSGGWMWYLCP